MFFSEKKGVLKDFFFQNRILPFLVTSARRENSAARATIVGESGTFPRRPSCRPILLKNMEMALLLRYFKKFERKI